MATQQLVAQIAQFLERVEKLGQMGDVVKVKDGFARNFLLPKKKALRATKANLTYFEDQRTQLEARNLDQKKEASAVAAKLEGQIFVLLRQAGGFRLGTTGATSLVTLKVMAPSPISAERKLVMSEICTTKGGWWGTPWP